MLLHQFVALGAKFQEGLRLFVKPLAVVTVKGGLLENAERSLGTEVILVVEAVRGAKNVIRRQAGILNVRQLVSAFIYHFIVADDESVFHRIIVKFGPRISMR